MILRWLTMRRFNFIDGVGMGLVGVTPSYGYYWAAASVFFGGAILSGALEAIAESKAMNE